MTESLFMKSSKSLGKHKTVGLMPMKLENFAFLRITSLTFRSGPNQTSPYCL
jgi:hypothetical protein